VKPRYQFNLKKMTADCEANYLRLSRLMPAVISLAEDAKESTSASGRYQFGQLRRELLVEFDVQQRPAHLLLQVTEQSRFTSMLSLSLSISGKPQLERTIGNSLAADISVRMYHDVRLAEVIDINGLKATWACYAGVNDHMLQPDEKAQQNRFLGELLSLSLHRGLATESLADFGLLDSLVGDAERQNNEAAPTPDLRR
jgi:uncharacterized protein YqiB (DUF1249 family)